MPTTNIEPLWTYHDGADTITMTPADSSGVFFTVTDPDDAWKYVLHIPDSMALGDLRDRLAPYSAPSELDELLPATPPALDLEQERRVLALKAAREVAQSRAVFGSSSVDAVDLIPLAIYIMTGEDVYHDEEDDHGPARHDGE